MMTSQLLGQHGCFIATLVGRPTKEAPKEASKSTAFISPASQEDFPMEHVLLYSTHRALRIKHSSALPFRVVPAEKRLSELHTHIAT